MKQLLQHRKFILFSTKVFTLLSLFISSPGYSQKFKNTDANDLETKKAIEKSKAHLKATDGKIWFQQNKGQFPASVQYGFSTKFGAMFVEQDKLVLVALKENFAQGADPSTSNSTSWDRQFMNITFEGGSKQLKVTPKGKLPTKINYFTSETSAGFVNDVNTFGELYINDVYPGVDLRLYSNQNGTIEFDWVLEHAKDYSKIKMRINGHEGINLRKDGGFDLKCRFETMSFKLPESYQTIDGKKHLVDMEYAMSNDNELVFNCKSNLQPEENLVIDPTVLWATYFEQTGGDYLFASESDNCGRVYLAGRTKGSAPASYIQGAVGYDNTYGGGYTGALYIFSADGDSIKAFSYFGEDITPQDLDIFPNGNVLVAGSRRDKNGGTLGSVPNVNSYSTAATAQGFVAIFNSEYATCLYSSHAPGTATEMAVTSVEIVDNNTYLLAGITDVNITTTGGTAATNLQFVTTTAPDNARTLEEGYITRFTGANYNTWQWGTYVGGNLDELFFSIKLSSDKSKITFAGDFESGGSAGFPTLVNPVDNVSVLEEGFVGYVNDGSTVPSSFGLLSYIGGAGNEGDLLVESMDNYIYVLGYTNSVNLPGKNFTGVFDSTLQGDYDAFISRIPFAGNTAPSGQFRSTYYGGAQTDISGGIIFNTNDSNLYMFLTTGSISTGLNAFPVKNTVPPSNFYDGVHGTNNGNWVPQTNSGIGSNSDIVFATITPDLTTNVFCSYCGGSDRDYLGNTGRLAGAGHYGFNRTSNIYSLGTTIHSNDLAANGSYIFSTNSFDTVSAGGDDHFIVKFNLSNTDMGDAPSSYDSTDPARHGTNSLGLTVAKFGVATTDYDSKPEASVQADGDDTRNTGPVLCSQLLDDEDGLITKDVLSVETNGLWKMTYRASNATGANAYVYAWIDLDGNGKFEADEFVKDTIVNKTFVSGITFSNAGAVITATKTAHGLTTANWVGFTGIEGNGSVLNGMWKITATTANTFTFTVNSAPAAAITGNEVAQVIKQDTLTWNTAGKSCPTTIVGGRTYIRMRITNSALTDNPLTNYDERSRGVTNTGEIEDHVLYIRGRDYGDLPSSYGNPSAMVLEDINANNIPEDPAAVWLGTLVDIEKDCAANNSALANGDDLETDDEDGLTFPSSPIKQNTTRNFTLNFGRGTAGSTIHYGMWFDWNADGDFTDANDGFYNGNTTAGSVVVPVTTASGVNFSPNFAVRVIARTTALASGDYAASFQNGEIEDYVNDPGILISGRVFDDGDGTYDNLIDGTNLNQPSSTQLWAYLVGAGVVVDSVAVLSDGTYYLQGAVAATAYEVRVTTTRINITGAAPTITLPTNWVNVGEQYGTNNSLGTGLEALTPASNSIVAVQSAGLNVTNVNFSKDFRPTSDDKTASPQLNPPGVILYTIPSLTGNDLEQGSFATGTGKTFRVDTLPGSTFGSAAADIYYNNVLITAGQIISNYDATLFKVDPLFSGAGVVKFRYSWRDSAQQFDLTPATVTMPFTEPSITVSGTVYNDGDGNTDLDVDGTPIGSPDGTQLYAYLDSAGIAVRKVTLPTAGPTTGQYTFTNVPVTTSYTVVISSTNVAINAATPGTAALPTNWVSTGEEYGTFNTAGSGLEAGTANSRIAITTQTTNMTAIDFGIEKRPESDDKTASSQLNPGGTIQVSVPLLTGSDLEDGSLPNVLLPSRTVIIDTLPNNTFGSNNATLYYNGVAITTGQVIANFDGSLLTTDPNFNGAGVIKFRYSWRDTAQFKDLTPATVTMPFTGLTLSGKVWHDGNGNTDNLINGVGKGNFANVQLYAYLVNGSNVIIDSSKVNPITGNYDLGAIDANSSYSVRISSTVAGIGAAAPGAYNLPSPWIGTGEQFGSNNASGNGIENTTPNGLIAVTSVATNITNVDFGIEYRPIAHDKLYTLAIDSFINNITGLPYWSYTHYLRLYYPSGTVDTTSINLTAGIMPGKLSGFDLENKRYNGVNPVTPANVMIYNLPDTSEAMLAYGIGGAQVFLKPNPGPLDPSFSFWDGVNSRYDIPNFNASEMFMYLKMASQSSTTFKYVYRDSAGVIGLEANYTLSYTSPVPVEITNFNCRAENKSIKLSWTTVSELNSKEFVIEKSANGMAYQAIGKIAAAGNSVVPKHYNFIDNNLTTGSYIYRLKSVDLGGAFEYSENCLTNFLDKNALTDQIEVYPNPTTETTTININASSDQIVSVELMNVVGQTIWKKNVTLISGVNQIDANMKAVVPGTYLIKVQGSSINSTVKIIKN